MKESLLKRNKSNRLFVFFYFIIFSLSVNAQQWLDVTDNYIKNSNYDTEEAAFWEGTTLSFVNPKQNAEHYSKTYDTYQDLSGLLPGKYRLSLNAFYRMGEAVDDYEMYKSGNYLESQHAKLYAYSSNNYYEVGILPISSGAVDQSLGGAATAVGAPQGWWGARNGPYVPNNMEAAYFWFEAGYYKNNLECEVGSDGVLRIGIKKDYTINADWTCIDTWKLEYYGVQNKVKEITLSNTDLTISENESFLLSYEIVPSDATNRKVTWSSSAPGIVTVDENGLVTAIKTGTVTITAKANDGSGITASCIVTVKGASGATDNNIIINEIMAANVDVYRDPSTNFGSWVELYNPTSQGVKLGGLYVSDDPSNLKKNRLVDDYGVLPANGYAILNFDHYEAFTKLSNRQINDKLDCDGGTIIISDGTNILAQQDYPAAIGRVSYARTLDGGDTWGNTGNPSPGKSNSAAGGFAVEQLPAPVVDKPGCIFTNSISVQVQIPDGTILRYTTNGTAPTLTNGTVSENGSFYVSNTTCYRFRFFKDGYLPSKVVTCSYIRSTNEPFPVISVVTDPNNISGSADYGLFMKGKYGRVGNDPNSGVCNWNMDWDRPVNFEYITTNNECVVSQECDFSMCGGWSRAWTPHSFKLKATKTYDLQNSFDYQFFDEKPYLKHKTLQIRNGGNDTGSRIKDAAIQQIAARSGLYVDYQCWQPVHVYINGKNHGVINMREPNNKHYAYANYGIDTDQMEQFEISPDSGYVQMEGTGEYFRQLCDLAKNASDASTYESIKKLVDIDEYINYMAVELYCGCNDWPQNNVKGFRDANDGKFHFVLFDTDFALNESSPLSRFKNCQYYTFNSLQGYNYAEGRSIQGIRYNNKEIEFVTLFLNMLKNEEFKKQFIDTYCLVGGSVYTPERVKAIVNEMADYLQTGGYVNPWGTANDIMNKFSSNRQSSMISHLQSYFNLSSSAKQNVTLSSDTDGAQILVNGIVVPTGKFSGALFGPVTYTAKAPAGYEFVGWTGDVGSGVTSTVFDFGTSWQYADTDITSTTWKSESKGFTKTGKSPIGYGKSGLNSTVSANKLAYYFGKSFTIADTPSSTDRFTLNYSIDDGMIVYVNGKEVARYNMSSGSVGYNTASSTYANGNPDSGSMEISASYFKKGTNYIAVEVHNHQTSSTDIYWDAQLTRTVQSKGSSNYLSTEPEYMVNKAGTFNLTACYEPIDDSKLVKKGTTPIKINEVSPANSSAVNDYFKKNDWIELYNTTNESVDVAGMYLSDNADKPQKYQIPHGIINTVIEPHGYLVIWADKLDDLTQLHASFKLDNADEKKVILTSEDGSWSDCLTYTAVAYGTQSVGLYPDGSNNVYVMNNSTIGSQNTIDSYVEFYSTYAPVFDPIYYTITFNDYDGSVISSSKVEEGTAISIPSTAERTGYTFAEWTPAVSEIANADATYTATYSVNSYKLIYMVDSEEYSTIEMEYGADIEPMAFPVKDGCEFSGWDNVPSTMPAEDVVVSGMFIEVIPDGIDFTSMVVDQEYYTVSGRCVGKERNRLSTGIYIVKYKLSDSRIIAKKIVVK